MQDTKYQIRDTNFYLTNTKNPTTPAIEAKIRYSKKSFLFKSPLR